MKGVTIFFWRMIPNYCDANNDEVNPKETDQITLMKQSDQVLCCLPLALQCMAH